MNYKFTNFENFLKEEYNTDSKILELVYNAENELQSKFKQADEIKQINQCKVLQAMQDARLNASHFDWSSGYGYDDPGRAKVEEIYSRVFHTEASLVRPNIVNGTHAISITLLGLLRPGDEFIEASGTPYDTLKTVIGTNSKSEQNSNFGGTLHEYGVKYKEVPLNKNCGLDLDAIKNSVKKSTRLVAFQRSTGYGYRPAISLDEIEAACEIIHNINPEIIVMVDNCYGEFVNTYEPSDIGVDIMAGSLIKNPGGGIALSGGYITGKRDLVEQISYRLTCPGIGAECGLTYGQNRHVLQGLFLAPSVVNSALKSAMLTGFIFDKLGLEVCPAPFSERSDIIQAIKFQNPDAVVSFCQSIQAASPVDSYVSPNPWDMPGYDNQVVMASGAFVSGSSIELSADAPLREPYIAYFQGGLTYEHGRFALIMALQDLSKKGIINLD